MTDNTLSTASLGAFERMVRSVTEKPLKKLSGRGSERSRAKSGLERLLRAIERTPTDAPKKKRNA